MNTKRLNGKLDDHMGMSQKRGAVPHLQPKSQSIPLKGTRPKGYPDFRN